MLQRLYLTDFHQRLRPVAGGGASYVSQDRQWTCELAADEHDQLQSFVATETARSRRWVRQSWWLNIPFVLLLLVIFRLVPVLKLPIELLEQVSEPLAFIALTAAWPLATLTWHTLVVRRTLIHVDGVLADHATETQLEHRGSRGLDALEIAALLLAGPGLILEVVQTFVPRLFSHTPYANGSLSVWSVLIISGVVIHRLRRALVWRGAGR